MALVALQNFSAGLEFDQALLTGTSSNSSNSNSNGDGGAGSSSSSPGGGSSSGTGSAAPGASSSNSSSQADAQQQQPQQQQQQAAVPLTGDMQLAVLFRSQKKQLLLDVISGLAEKLNQVCHALWVYTFSYNQTACAGPLV
jgi:hypothetical protein